MRTTSRSPESASRRNQRAGFTLVELAVVTMIIGILASVVAPMVHGSDSQGRRFPARG